MNKDKLAMRQKGKEKRACLNITRDTKDALDSVKHSGQSYEGIIQELITIKRRLLEAGFLPGKDNYGNKKEETPPGSYRR